MQVLGTATIVA